MNLASAGASAKALARAAADEAGYLELQRNAAWWLGENANLACNEFAGSLAPEADFNENEAPAGTTSPLETAALEVRIATVRFFSEHLVNLAQLPTILKASC